VGQYTLALVDAPGLLPTTPRKMMIHLPDNVTRIENLSFGMKSNLTNKLYLPSVLRGQ
jgi:hypothetical protein